jgi:phosphate transport system ATP-binding protein
MTTTSDIAAPAKYSISTRDLSLWYGKFQALKNVTINIKPGIITSLIGPSGCGKTTLLRCFNRINERYGSVTTTGQIMILCKNIYDPDVSLTQLRRTVGMVFQRPNPMPISVYENVIFGLRVHRGGGSGARSQRNEIVEAALREVGLWDDVKDNLNRKATRLSLEQQQKLAIARLLPLKPRVILMDEPCSALDTEGTAKIESLIESLRERFTIVMVTHNMSQARRASDECLFMLLGEVVEHGKTADIFFNPKDPRTEMYVAGRYG